MENAYCPYCGGEMCIQRGASGYWFECTECLTTSPLKKTEKEAYKAAMARPLQKPLTLEEACGSEEPCVYIEYKGREIEAGIVYKQGTLNDVVLIIKRVESYREDCKSSEDYGKIVRCWAKNPTDEERKAAKWEE